MSGPTQGLVDEVNFVHTYPAINTYMTYLDT